MIKRLVRIHWPLALPFFFVCLVLQAWLQPGPIVGEDWIQLSPTVLANYFPWPHTWDPSTLFGINTSLAEPTFPLLSVAGLLAHLGAGFETIERVCWLWPYLVLAPLGSYLLVFRLTRSAWGAAVGASVFSVNTWTVFLVERGHMPALDAYALSPFVVMQCLAFIRTPSARRGLLLAALLTAQIVYDLRYAYISIAVCIVLGLEQLIRDRSLARLKRAWGGLGSLVAGLAVFNLYWLIPTILAPPFIPIQRTSVAEFVGLSSFATFIHSLALFTPFYHHVAATNGFLTDPVEPAFLLVPAAVLLALAVAWHRRWALPTALLAILGILIVAGPSSPFGFVDRFFYVYVPGGSMYRDITKFTALVALAYTLALGIGFARFAAFARARWHLRNRALLAGAGLAILVGYTALMQGAFDPRRFSNFAASPPRPQDIALQRFLDSQRGDFRTIVFPALSPTVAGTDSRPLLDGAGFTASFPFGFGQLSADRPDIFELFRSPLIAPLLRELNIRYIVVIDDPSGMIYQPFELHAQRNQSIDFFLRQPWLQLAARFAGYAVFELRGSGAPATFVAPQPALFNGSGPSLGALAGTSFWNNRAAVILSEQVLDPSALYEVPNKIAGAVLIDPLRGVYYQPLPKLLPMLATTTKIATFAPADYHGVALTRFAMTHDLLDWRDNYFFHNIFSTATSAPATMQYRIEPAEQARQLSVRQQFGLNAALRFVQSDSVPQIFNPASIEVDLTDAAFVPVPPAGLGPGVWKGVFGSSAVISILNPTPLPETADIIFPAMVSSELRARRIRFDIIDSLGAAPYQHTFSVPGRTFGWLLGGGVPVRLNNVSLHPGINRLQLQVIGPGGEPEPLGYASASIYLRSEIGIEKPRYSNERFRAVAMPAEVRPLSDGAALTGTASAGPDVEQRAIVDLLGDLNVPLERHPRLQLRFVLPHDPVSLRLIIRLRRHSDGRPVEYSRLLAASEAVEDEDLFKTVQHAFDVVRESQVDDHARDPSWLRARWRDLPEEASGYSITGVRVGLVKPAGVDTTGISRGQYVAEVSGAGLATRGDVLAPETPRAADLARFAGLDIHKGISATGLTVTEVDASTNAVNLNVQLAQDPQAVKPSEIVVGDTVRVRLNDGSAIEGTVAQSSGDVITVHTPEQDIGIERAAIAEIAGTYRWVPQLVSLRVPVRAKADDDLLALDAKIPTPLRLDLRLGFSTGAHDHNEVVVFPSGRRSRLSTEDAIPSGWITPIDLPGFIKGVTLDQPVVLQPESSASQLTEPQWVHYQIDLGQVRGYRLRRYPHAVLRSVYLRIVVPPETPTATLDIKQIGLANVAAISAHSSDADTAGILGKAVVTVDGNARTVKTVRPDQDGEASYGRGAPMRLSPGRHEAQSLNVFPYLVDSALLSQGAPKRSPPAAVSDYHEITRAEYSAHYAGGGGMLVWPVTFDSRWSLAIVGAGGPRPSGFALLDAFRFRKYQEYTEARHFEINGLLNGWLVPSGDATLVFLYTPDAFAQAGLIAFFVLTLALVGLTVNRRSRRSWHPRRAQ